MNFYQYHPSLYYYTADCDLNNIVNIHDVDPFTRILTPDPPTQPTDVTPWHTDSHDLYKGIGGKGITYTYQSTSTAEGSDLYFNFSWGDSTSTMVGPASSSASASHAYASIGNFNITVSVQHGATGLPASNSSTAHQVRMFKLGDVQGDNKVTFADIDPFVAALSGKTAFYATSPTMYWYTADCNLDNMVTFADIDPFVALLGT